MVKLRNYQMAVISVAVIPLFAAGGFFLAKYAYGFVAGKKTAAASIVANGTVPDPVPRSDTVGVADAPAEAVIPPIDAAVAVLSSSVQTQDAASAAPAQVTSQESPMASRLLSLGIRKPSLSRRKII